VAGGGVKKLVIKQRGKERYSGCLRNHPELESYLPQRVGDCCDGMGRRVGGITTAIGNDSLRLQQRERARQGLAEEKGEKTDNVP